LEIRNAVKENAKDLSYLINFAVEGVPIGFFTNPWVLTAWAVTVGLQVCAVYIPFLQRALHTVPLGLSDWGLMFLVAAPILLAAELVKWLNLRSKQ
jgi:magnesium-transporting ATPase (P-type)